MPSPELLPAKAVAAAPAEGITAAIAPTGGARIQRRISTRARAPHVWVSEPFRQVLLVDERVQRTVCFMVWGRTHAHVQQQK